MHTMNRQLSGSRRPVATGAPRSTTISDCAAPRRLSGTAGAPHRRLRFDSGGPALRAKKRTSGSDSTDDDLQQKFFSSPYGQRSAAPDAPDDPAQPQQRRRAPTPQTPQTPAQQAPQQAAKNIIDNVNPYQLGRQARRAFDDVWGQLSAITAPTKSYVFDDLLDPSLQLESDPDASGTTVLVAGATGRVGRILIRKLLLRGYRVRALIRRREGIRESTTDIEGLPSAVEIINGDVGELRDCQKAIKGVDKVIFCAAARTAFTGDLNRVEDRGVAHLAAALQDELFRRAKASGSKYSRFAKKEVADFNRIYHQLRWDVTFVGVQGDDGSIRRDAERTNLAVAEISEGNNLVFTGALFSRGAFAECGAELNPLLPGGDQRLADTEGLTLRVKAEGHSYACVLRTAEGYTYSARFPTRVKYSTIRLPWALFRSEADGQPPLNPAAITNVAVRYELRRPAAPAAAAAAAAAAASSAVPAGARPPPGAVPAGLGAPPAGAAMLVAPPPQQQALLMQRRQQQQQAAQSFLERFKLEVDWIKALPAGVEPEFVLVSCSGSGRPGVDAEDMARITAAKRRGEEHLRTSGLGYTVIRPGALVDEPGGYKALVFDQSDRVGQSVSAADVADICLRALREPEARNKTFDVCYEYQPDEGLQLYELVASIPSSRGNYLASALSTLAKNT